MPDEVPVADFGRDVVLWFAEPHGSSCMNSRLDGVDVDQDRSIITPILVMSDNQTVCTADLRGAHHYFVALERDRLPDGPFWIQLGTDDPPGGFPQERTIVNVDLSSPGSITRKGDAHLDREGLKAEPLPLSSGVSIQPRRDVRYAIDARCGVSSLGVLNDIHWVRRDATVPPAWADATGADGEIIATIRIRGGKDPFIDAVVGETSLRYEPTRADPVPCEPDAA
jgi:hypothetical protein